MSRPGVKERLPASERRAAVLDTACRVFARCSYRGATTAEIAREAGVTEPILYRHFDSKRALYLACIDGAWRQVRATWEQAIASEPDPGEWISTMARCFQRMDREQRLVLSTLWVQALAEETEDPEIRRYARRHLRDVHDYATGVLRRAQAAGGIPADRDVEAEGWIFVALGLLGSIGRRLGAVSEEDFDRIRLARRRWLTGG
jgi:AcrR family transcriptional regulator